MADPPNHLSQQTLLPSPVPSNRRARWWVSFAKWTGILASLYLLGPAIYLARDTQREAGGCVWQAEERWSHVFGSAVLSLLWYVPVLVFHSALASFWTSSFWGLALFLHLPFIRGLSGTSFWLPIPSSMLLRWVLALPLTSWIALLLEAIRPQTTWGARRVVSPDEQVELATAQAAEEKKRQAAQARRSSQVQLTASKKPVSTGKPSHSSTKRSSPTHAALASQPATLDTKHTASLWDQVDWSRVPDDHSLKQAALEEAERQAAERTRIVLSQMAQQATTPTTKGATNELVSPPPVSAYNWDEGEGTVTDS